MLNKIYINQYGFFKKNIKKYFFIALIVYICSIILFYLAFYNDKSNVMNIMNSLKSDFSSRGFFTTSVYVTFLKIFENNLRSCFIFGTLLGVVPFIYIPVIFVACNGFILSVVLLALNMEHKNILISIITTLLPHGILELTAFFYASALGIYITIWVMGRIRHKTNIGFKEVGINVVKSYLTVIIPLLFVAAFVEAYITPVIAGLR